VIEQFTVEERREMLGAASHEKCWRTRPNMPFLREAPLPLGAPFPLTP